jgi:hypothetical protein
MARSKGVAFALAVAAGLAAGMTMWVGCVAPEGEEGEGEQEGCAGLCTGAGFDDGEETDFGGGVVECVCEGSGDGIAEADCDAYCADFDVGPEDALRSENASPNDKCVCDGTSP